MRPFSDCGSIIRTLIASVWAAFMLCAFSPDQLMAQEVTVQGNVTEYQTGAPLPGVNVVVEGTTTGTTTGINGTYTLEVPSPNAVLVFSFVGYREQRVQVGDQTTIDVTMRSSDVALEEVVVTGYGQQQRQNITGSVSSVDVAEASVGQVGSPQDLIQGRVPGVSLQSNSGEPGAGVNVRIRGTTSISANNEPLYVIDGVPVNSTTITPDGASLGGVTSSSTTNPLSLINPQDIESIQVLKDASATAIYGSQGAGGVILIETKGGGRGDVQVDYSGKVSLGTLARDLDLLSANEYRDALERFLDQDVSGSGGTDWQDATTETAITHEHNLSFSGGNESTTYRASLGYLDNRGIIEDTGIERVTARVNADHSTLADRLRFNLNLTGSYLKRNHTFFNQGGGFQAGVMKSMIAADPRLPVKQDDGTFTDVSTTIRNPVAMNRQIVDITDEKRILGNFSVEGDILENLTASGNLGVDLNDGIRRTGIPNASTIGRDVGGLARQGERNLSNLTVQSTLQYNRDIFGEHTVEALGGYEFKRGVFQDLGVETRNFITDATLFNNLGGGANVSTPFSEKQIVEQISYFGRFNYNIKDRYLLQATVRRDGSSVFGENEQFAWFPSASIGWRLTNEPFLEDVDWLTQLKLRVSAGGSGNQAVPPFQALPTLDTDESFADFFGDESEILGVAPQRAANPDLKWEETTEYNVGVDFAAGRFSGAFDIYTKTTTDLLLDVRVPQPAQSSFVLQNVGEVRNQGVELSLDAFVVENDALSLNVGATASSNFNEVRDLGGRGSIDHTEASGAGQTGVLVQRLQPGHPIGAFYGPIFTGINEDGDETYRSVDGGTTTSLANAEETFLGNPIPDVAYSFNINFRYNDFDLSAFFRGEEGRELFNNTAMEFTSKTNLGTINVLREAVNDGTNTGHVQTYSSRWIHDASFFRLDKLTLGYTFPAPDRFQMRRFRLYATGSNLFVITPYEGFDPEVNTNADDADTGFRALARPDRGIDYTSFPRARTFTLGLELGF